MLGENEEEEEYSFNNLNFFSNNVNFNKKIELLEK